MKLTEMTVKVSFQKLGRAVFSAADCQPKGTSQPSFNKKVPIKGLKKC